MKPKAVFFLAALIFLFACRQQNYGLNPLPQETDTFVVFQKIINHLEDTSIEKTIRLKFALQFLDKVDSNHTFRFTILSVKMDPTPSYLTEVVNFDSLQTALASNPYQVSVDKTGKVKILKGVSTIENNIFAAFSNRYIARSFTEDHLGGKAVEDLLNRFFSVVPHKKIKEGDNWVKDISLITKAPIKYSNLFTHEGENGDSIFIRIKSLIAADQGDASNVYMKGNQAGEVVINSKTGMPYVYYTQATMVTTTVAGDRSTDEIMEIKRSGDK